MKAKTVVALIAIFLIIAVLFGAAMSTVHTNTAKLDSPDEKPVVREMKGELNDGR